MANKVRIGEVVSLSQGFAVNAKSKHLMSDSGLPLLRITDLINGTESQYLTEETAPEKCIAREDEIIFTRTGQVGLVFRGKNGVVHNNCFKVIPNREVLEPDFLYWFLKQPHIVKLANDIASGSVQKDLNHSAFNSIEIDLLDLKQQKNNTQILNRIEEKITLNRQTNQTLEQMAQALFKSWFVDFDPVFDNALTKGVAVSDFPEALQKRAQARFEQRQLFDDAEPSANKKTDVKPLPAAASASEELANLFPSEFEQTDEPSIGINGWIPKGWETKTIKSVTTALSKGTTPRKKDIEGATDHSVTKFIKVKDIDDDGSIKLAGLETVPMDVHKGVLKRSILKESDVLFTIAGTIGRVAIVNTELCNSNCNQAVAFIRAINQDYARFLFCYLKTTNVQTLISSKVVQAVQANVSLGELGGIEFPAAPEKVINEWNKIIESIFSKVELCRKNTDKLSQIRDVLLPKLISGELQLPQAYTQSEAVAQ